MKKFINYILKLREKPENVRRQILAGSLTVCMVIVGGVWVLSLGSHFSSGEAKIKTKEDVKPFTLFKTKIKNTYEGLAASAAKSDIPQEEKVVEQKITPNKVIDLIPIEQ